MPNFVRNKILVGRSEYGRRLIDKYCTYDHESGRLEFDFNKIIKMPEDLQIEFSSKSDHALCLYLTKINPEVDYYGCKEDKMDRSSYGKLIKELSKRTIANHDFTLGKDEIDEVLNRYKEKDSESNLLDLGRKQIENLENYDAINWYEWAINNWGTKWNASDFESSDDNKSITFDTAWDPSVEIMMEISKQNPDIRFGYLYSDEAIGSHVGYMLLQAGRIDFKGEFNDYSYDAYKLAFDLWGCGEDYEYDEKMNTFVLKEDYSSMEME